jgi:signal transduction histidine kinase
MRVQYQLQGLDKEWMEAGARRSVLYSQLAPGHYRFRVIACNRDGVWNKQGATLGLTVPFFWWETAWFQVGGTLGAFGVVVGLVIVWLRRRQQFKIEKLQLQQAIERDRVRIAQDLHDDLGAGLTEVAMLSEVVRRCREKPEEVNTHAQRIFASSIEMTQALDEIVWSVNPANDTLDKLVAFVCEYAQALLGSAEIRCWLEMPDHVPDMEVSSQIRHQVCMALKECLTNVIKHARAKKVTLTIRLDGRILAITVEDDGVGFDPARVKDATGTHDGLMNLKRRLAIMNGTCDIESAPRQGTRVHLQMRI